MRETLMLIAIALCPILASAGGPANKITHGPILGRVSARGIGVWARSERAGTFHVRYGLAPGKLDQKSADAATTLDRDNTGWVHLKRLKGGTRYYYQLVCNGNAFPDKPATFRTLPDAADYVEAKVNPKGLYNFRFEFACGNDQRKGRGIGPSLPTFKTMLDRHREQIDFAILNGDWLYEDGRDHTVAAWCKQVGLGKGAVPKPVAIAPTLVGVWQNYKLFLDRGENLRKWHSQIPSFFTFDDHEILNDVWGAGDPGVRERRAVFRDIGVKAWYDYLGWSNPTEFPQPIHFGNGEFKKGSDILVDEAADFTKLDLKQVVNLHVHWGKPNAGVDDNKLDAEKPGNPNAGVFGIVKVLDKHRLQIRPAAYADGTGSYSIGKRSYYRLRLGNCDFFVLDTRSFRMMHDLKDPAKKGISMIGLPQKEWLMAEMKKSDADFLFVVSSVNFMIPHVGGGYIRGSNKDDAWTVFLDEREQLIRFWDGLNKRVFVLTGDLHNSFVIKVTDRVWEFASGPHNSQNHKFTDEGDRPANGSYDSRGRKCDIRWSSYFLDDIQRDQLRHPMYCIVQVNNVWNSPKKLGEYRWVAYPRPQVIFQYYDGRNGEMRYAESIHAVR